MRGLNGIGDKSAKNADKKTNRHYQQVGKKKARDEIEGHLLQVGTKRHTRGLKSIDDKSICSSYNEALSLILKYHK